MDANVRFDTQIVGALPVITQYMERLGLAEFINEVVPWEDEVPLGTVGRALGGQSAAAAQSVVSRG